ncbi:hypothetical protein GTR02_20795 [Kineococcus sp. R8]|nr:hypothetical protein [Kineococcus siccus]
MRRGGARLVPARDLLGLRRAPARTAVACAAGLGAALLLVTAAPGSAAGVLAAVGLHVATAGWAAGLAAHVENAEGSGLVPDGAARVFARHLLVPGLLTAAVTLAPTTAAVLLGAASPAAATTAASLALLAVAARAWQTSAPLLPASLLTPVLTPAGDLSGLLVAAWFARGWLLVAGVAALAGPASSAGAAVPPAIAVAAAVAVALRTARRARSWV